jgi:uncharacterized surface protein with fasciclin (FAS1) repeats
MYDINKMVSIGPYTQPSDFRHMYDFVDLRKKDSGKFIPKMNTIMGIIKNNKDFTIFSNIVEKAGYVDKLSDERSDFTIFVPSDIEIRKKYSDQYFHDIDKCVAQKILTFSMMKRKIDQKLLQSSPVCIFPTLDKSNSVHINTFKGITKMNLTTSVIHWNHPADNGIIHVVDNILINDFMY